MLAAADDDAYPDANLAFREERPDGGEATTTGGADAPAVFVVDDDPGTLELLCEVAREAGWDARPFTRLIDLRASLDHLRPTLLILDDDLPDGRGRRLRARAAQ